MHLHFTDLYWPPYTQNPIAISPFPIDAPRLFNFWELAFPSKFKKISPVLIIFPKYVDILLLNNDIDILVIVYQTPEQVFENFSSSIEFGGYSPGVRPFNKVCLEILTLKKVLLKFF